MKKANRTVAVCIRLSPDEEKQLFLIARQLGCEGNRSEALRLLMQQAYNSLVKPDKLGEVHSMVSTLVDLMMQQRATLNSSPLKPNQNTHRDPRPENENLV